jgi:hypothetical protein
VGTLCLIDREAVFFSQKWGRLVARRVSPLRAIEAREGFLLDELVLVAVDGARIRFDLLAGQMESAQEVVRGPLPSSPAT